MGSELAAARRSSSRQKWDEAALMQAVGEVAPNAVPELRRLLDHYRERVELYYWGQGASPSVTATFRFGGWRVQPWSIYTGDYLGVAVNFDWMKALGDERRSELLRKLLSIPGTEPKLAGVAEAGFAKRPTLSLAGVLDQPAGMDRFIDAFDAALA